MKKLLIVQEVITNEQTINHIIKKKKEVIMNEQIITVIVHNKKK